MSFVRGCTWKQKQPLFLYLEKMKEFHIVQTHKPFKTKDGYTVSTSRIVEGPKPAENKWESSEKPLRNRNRKKF